MEVLGPDQSATRWLVNPPRAATVLCLNKMEAHQAQGIEIKPHVLAAEPFAALRIMHVVDTDQNGQ